MMQKAVFMDRDGTINVDKHYLYRKEDFEFIDGVPSAIRKFHEMGYLVITVTNQSGIARGLYSEEDMKQLHEYINTLLAQYRTQIDAFYYCPHLSDGIIPKYRTDCPCRKPKSGLFKQAVQDWNIDPCQSIAIGDNERDLIPAHGMGMQCFLLSAAKKQASNNLWITIEQISDIFRHLERKDR